MSVFVFEDSLYLLNTSKFKVSSTMGVTLLLISVLGCESSPGDSDSPGQDAGNDTAGILQDSGPQDSAGTEDDQDSQDMGSDEEAREVDSSITSEVGDTVQIEDSSSDTGDLCADLSAGTVTLSNNEVFLDWWGGQEAPNIEIIVTAEVPQCANLVTHVSADWLNANLSGDTLSITLNTDAVLSGIHSALVEIWDTDEDIVTAEMEIVLSSLVQPVDEQSRNVLVVGVDGLDGEELESISAPVIEQLMQRGFWSYAAHTQLTGDTSSGPGWTSIMSGVETSKHGVTSNGGYEGRNTAYPSFLYRARMELGLSTAASIQWPDIWSILEDDSYDASGSGNMEEVSATMAALLRSGLHQVHFVHLDDVDGAGHSYGYLASETVYYDTVLQVDRMVGDMLTAILERPDIEHESWLVVLTADHGGDEWGSHGGRTSDYQTIPLVIASPGWHSTQLADSEGSHLDVHPTVVDFLGLNSEDYGLDGTSWVSVETDCTDGVDDDEDGDIDCEDLDCAVDVSCVSCPAYDLGDSTGNHVVADVPFEHNGLVGNCGGDGFESTYGWTAPADGRYSFDTVGGYRDTVLYTLNGECGGEELACSDDIAGLSSGRSGFSMDLESGESLVIVVDSFDLGQTSSSVLSIYPYTPSCPDEDLGTDPGVFNGTLTSINQAHQEGCPPAVGNLEFNWTAPEDRIYTFSSSGSDFDTVIYVLDGCGGTEITCNDDTSGSYQSLVTFSASAGETYVLGIGGFDGDQGSYVFKID
jgi:hypothetical protein